MKILTLKNLKKEITVESNGGFYIGQSMAVSRNYYIVTLLNCPKKVDNVCKSDNTRVLFYDRETKKLVKTLTRDLGHSNGITDNPKTMMLYSTNPTYEFSYSDVPNIDKVSFQKMKWKGQAIAFDNVTNQYYLKNRNSKTNKDELYIYNSNFEFIKKFELVRQINQDCAAFRGLALCVRYPGANAYEEKMNGNIDVYRVSNNAYVGTINVNTLNARCNKAKGCGIELEGLAYVILKGKFALFYNYTGHPKLSSGKTGAALIYTTTDFPITKK